MTTYIKHPYAICADVHFHNWTFGSYVNTEGVNSRLQHTIDEFKRMCATLREQGGRDVVIAGDMFHVRGEIKPSVFNPVYQMFKSECEENGMQFFAIPGNHDLETEDTEVKGTCFASFEAIDNFNIFYRPTNVYFNDSSGQNAIFLPWKEDFWTKSDLPFTAAKTIVFAHVGLNDVIDGLKGSISAMRLHTIDDHLQMAFCGHFHNHKDFEVDDGERRSVVYSIGALTHQSFKDVGSTAGFIIVEEPNKVTHHPSKAPEFVDYTYHDFISPEEVYAAKFQGNFVRISQGLSLTEEESAAIRCSLESTGALRVINRATPTKAGIPVTCPVTYTFGSTGKTKVSKEIAKFVQSKYDRLMADKIMAILDKEDFDE